jgi:hypothetical protein
MTLQRLILTFDAQGGIRARVLYKRHAGGPGPSTKARSREVAALARTGLKSALKALKEGPVESIGTSGFETREDVLSLFSRRESSSCSITGEEWHR